jgi:hypothetical protein
MLVSAFTLNPDPSDDKSAPIFLSIDGGKTWSIRAIVPSARVTADITHAIARDGQRAYAGILSHPDGASMQPLVYKELSVLNFAETGAISELHSSCCADQPYTVTGEFNDEEYVVIGLNDFKNESGQTASLRVLPPGGQFSSVVLDPRPTAGQDAPSVRASAAQDGTIYAAYISWRTVLGDVEPLTITADIVVAREDSPHVMKFKSLLDGSDGLPGQRVAVGVTIPWTASQPGMGLERIGSSLAIGVNPADSSTVYLVWGDKFGSDTYTLHLRRSQDRGRTWSSDLRTIHNATSPALAVSSLGVVGFFYQQFTGSDSTGNWDYMLEQSRDDFTTIKAVKLATVPTDRSLLKFLPYNGDYTNLICQNDTFMGVFSANNSPDLSHFPNGVQYQRLVDFGAHRLLDGYGMSVATSIDPFFYSVPIQK